jgi:branched-chain amino acid aminotransferase
MQSQGWPFARSAAYGQDQFVEEPPMTARQDPAPLAYLCGTYLPQSQLSLRLDDAGFLFGATIVDRCRTFGHRLFRFGDHVARFRRSCALARVPLALSDEELSGIAEALVAHNTATLTPHQDLALVLFATPGSAAGDPSQVGRPDRTDATFGMHTSPFAPARYAHLFRQGAHLLVPAIRHVPADCIDPHIKHRSRLHWWIAEQEAHEIDPQASALLLDAHGYITETASANFLLVQQGAVLSPPREAILEGIGLRVIEEQCGELGIPFREQKLTLADCESAGEAMLTSSSYGLAGVSRINGTPVAWPGPVLKRLIDAYGKCVNLNVPEQFCGASLT